MGSRMLSSISLANDVGALSDNGVDSEYLLLDSRLSNQVQLEMYISEMRGPDDLPDDLTLLQSSASKHEAAGRRAIYDADGDGVEDNKFDNATEAADELDKFYDPLAFGVAEDLNNTHHGNLPGHVQAYFDTTQAEPADHYGVARDGWANY